MSRSATSKDLALSKIAFKLLLLLWAGSLWSSVWTALVIFRSQPDRHLAGMLAARLFAIETYLGLAVALAALLARADRFHFGFVAAALLAVNEWVIKGFMDRALVQGAALGLGFGPWHGISAIIYLGACVAVSAAVSQYILRSTDENHNLMDGRR